MCFNLKKKKKKVTHPQTVTVLHSS